MDSRTRTRRVIALIAVYIAIAFLLDYADINSLTANALLFTMFLVCLYQLARKPRHRR